LRIARIELALLIDAAYQRGAAVEAAVVAFQISDRFIVRLPQNARHYGTVMDVYARAYLTINSAFRPRILIL